MFLFYDPGLWIITNLVTVGNDASEHGHGNRICWLVLVYRTTDSMYEGMSRLPIFYFTFYSYFKKSRIHITACYEGNSG